jgi:hypothetical protein
MTIVSAECTSFKVERYQAIHNLTTDVLKIALYTSSASLDASTTVYTTSGEIPVVSGYTAGGKVITGVTIASSGTTAYVDFADAAFTGLATTAAGALVYNSSKANRAICVLAFGSDKTSNAVNGFTVVFPAFTTTTAILRTE